MKTSAISLILSLVTIQTALGQSLISPLQVDLPNQMIRGNSSDQQITVPVRNTWIAMDFTGMHVGVELSVNSIAQEGHPTPTLPRIQNIDLSESIFGSQSTSGSGAVDGSQMDISYLGKTPVEMAIGEHTLATITFDTTGITDGIYDLGVSALFFSENGGQVAPINSTSPTISVVPEPSTYVLVSGLSLFGIIGVRRLRR